ncbi:23S rRNA (uracil(1939)-C(5))-methyltransferase RlmD [Candidatus Marinamargulisbacteria bacterium SCGC AG-414-C22]|nr:23S rRNA (uracil(1939)-C(5))-methyltransferase RlmD [Candidatus Marinamargulisbacteria bacterium SCGC AG-414-C22]
MLKKNDYHQAIITDQSASGSGITYIQNNTVFVPNTLPGDVVKLKIIKITNSRYYAKLIDILTPSKQRVEPKCAIAATCGGCQLQHQSYDNQLTFKQHELSQTLATHLHNQEDLLKPFIQLTDPWEFRHKMQFSFALENNSNDLAIGLYAARSHRVINTTYCPITSPTINAIINTIKHWFKAFPTSVFSETTGAGILRHVTIRQASTNQHVMIIFTLGSELLHHESLLTALTQHECVKSIYTTIQADPTNDHVFGKDLQLLWGDDRITDTIDHCRYSLSPLSFTQANSKLVSQLYQYICHIIKQTNVASVFDLYCGTGLLSIMLAKQELRVTGVDNNKHAIDDAKHNATLNQVNATFITAHTEEFFAQEDLKESCIILDPPRRGCHPDVLTALGTSQPPHIIYVSCNPVTLNRDLTTLVAAGYTLISIQPFDMFCHTTHCEVVVYLSYKN